VTVAGVADVHADGFGEVGGGVGAGSESVSEFGE